MINITTCMNVSCYHSLKFVKKLAFMQFIEYAFVLIFSVCGVTECKFGCNCLVVEEQCVNYCRIGQSGIQQFSVIFSVFGGGLGFSSFVCLRLLLFVIDLQVREMDMYLTTTDDVIRARGKFSCCFVGLNLFDLRICQ